MNRTSQLVTLALALLSTLRSNAAEPLPGTAALGDHGDLASDMVAGIDRFLMRQTDLAPARRSAQWQPDYSSPETYQKSLDGKRARLRKILGVVDQRLPCTALEYVSSTAQPALIGSGAGLEIYRVRWPVLLGVDGEGLLLLPATGEMAALKTPPTPPSQGGEKNQRPAGSIPQQGGEKTEIELRAGSTIRISVPASQDRGKAREEARSIHVQGPEVVRISIPSNQEIHVEGRAILSIISPPLQAGAGGVIQPRADCIIVPDCDMLPEDLAGLTNALPREAQIGRRLAEQGARVLIPVLIDRRTDYSILPGRGKTGQPHREWIYRQAYEMGRHILGYEVQKILAAAEFFQKDRGPSKRKLGLFGYGEGGWLAQFAGALEPAFEVVAVSGSFRSRQHVWEEPIDHNVWSLLEEFGDAELAAMVAPRTLIIEAARGPSFFSPADGKGPTPGKLDTPPLAQVGAEFKRALDLIKPLKQAPRFEFLVAGDGLGGLGTSSALDHFASTLGINRKNTAFDQAVVALAKNLDSKAPQKRQFDQLVDFTQGLMRESEYTRRTFWAKADRKSRSPEAWEKSTGWYRDYFDREVIGRFADSVLPPRPRTRLLYEQPTYRAYEVVLDVFPDVFAYGWFLVPKDLKPGERRPVVVCQHGLEGKPEDVADPKMDSPYYHRFACQLAERGFLVFAPQNPYIFRDRFRTLQRKANPLKKSLFSIIVAQHRQITGWLASLPEVDPRRIGFYGLSYGGKTAMRVPALLEAYCLSICSADFNEWIWKNASTRSSYSYMGTGEYEMFEFDLGNTFNYAEMAGLIAPRPFMVERGHRDGVAPDEWVGFEFAKVRQLYADLKIPDRVDIEFFDGPHMIHGVGTFEFLHKHLQWPRPKP